MGGTYKKKKNYKSFLKEIGNVNMEDTGLLGTSEFFLMKILPKVKI
jgi:hypothetical protein